MNAEEVGNLGGWWSILLRLALASHPLLITWVAWASVNIIQHDTMLRSGDRFMSSDAVSLERRQNKARAELADRLEAKIQRIEDNTSAIGRDTARVLGLLERLAGDNGD